MEKGKRWYQNVNRKGEQEEARGQFCMEKDKERRRKTRKKDEKLEYEKREWKKRCKNERKVRGTNWR